MLLPSNGFLTFSSLDLQREMELGFYLVYFFFRTQNQFKGSSVELPRRKEFSDIIFVELMRLTSLVRFTSTGENVIQWCSNYRASALCYKDKVANREIIAIYV